MDIVSPKVFAGLKRLCELLKVRKLRDAYFHFRVRNACYTRQHAGASCMKASKGEAGGGNSITALLHQLSEGNREVEPDLIPQIYGELRRLAARYMRYERKNHTLQPTALVHEEIGRAHV